MEQADEINQKDRYLGLRTAFTAQQKKLHVLEDLPLSASEIDIYKNQAYTSFSLLQQKASWYYPYKAKMEKMGITINSDNDTPNSLPTTSTIKFRLDREAHNIYGSILEQNLPSIIFNPGYEGHWTPDIGLVILQRGSLKLGTKSIYNIDCAYNLCQREQLSRSDKEVINEEMGNIPVLQTFSEKLPTWKVLYKPPWDYSKQRKNFPILFIGLNDELIHEITFIRNIEKLLIVRKTTGELVKKLDSSIIKSINGFPCTSDMLSLPEPDIYGLYAYKDMDECDKERNPCDGKPPNYWVEDRIAAPVSNIYNIGEEGRCVITFPKTRSPYKIDFFIQNQTSVSNNYYSNGSTNSENHSTGYNTYDSISIKIDNKYLVNKSNGIYFNRFASEFDKNIKMSNGYGIYTTSINNDNPKSGFAVDKEIEISFTIKDTNPFNSISDNILCQDKFKVYAFATFYKEIVFKTYPKNDDEKRTISTEMIID